jgi:16S rRNA (guanine1207-N2)-methyltransferase
MIISAVIKGFEFEFETSDGVFSPRRIDAGTLAMLSFVEFTDGLKVLDLGCGYGVVGITAAKFTDPANVFMLDVEPEAVELARKNAARNGADGVNVILSDGFDSLDETGFDCILSNPPYHTDFAVAKRFIEKGFNRLKLGGRMYMVTKRKDWYKNKLSSVFGGVRIYEADGYYVFETEKRSSSYSDKAKKNRN